MYPFLKKNGKRTYIKLQKELYSENIINQVCSQDPEAISSVELSGDYFFIELNTDSQEDCFNFLNYLIYCRRAI